MKRHLLNLGLNISVLAWVAWRGITDMMIADEAPWDVVAVVIAALYLLAGPFAWSLWRSVRRAKEARDEALRRTFE